MVRSRLKLLKVGNKSAPSLLNWINSKCESSSWMACQRRGVIWDATFFASFPVSLSQRNLSQVPRREGMARNLICESNKRIITPDCKILRMQGNSTWKSDKSLIDHHWASWRLTSYIFVVLISHYGTLKITSIRGWLMLITVITTICIILAYSFTKRLAHTLSLTDLLSPTPP